jgi:hypothetical protein
VATPKSKESLRKAAALKLKLKRAAVLAADIIQEHTQAAQDAADLEASLAAEHEQDAPEEYADLAAELESHLAEEYADLANVQSAKKSLWKRFVIWFNA